MRNANWKETPDEAPECWVCEQPIRREGRARKDWLSMQTHGRGTDCYREAKRERNQS